MKSDLRPWRPAVLGRRWLAPLGLVLLAVAALGTYFYARRLGASRSAAVLAGLSYAYSGYMVTQLRRVAAASIAALLLPLGLFLVDYITSKDEPEGPRLPRKVLASAGLATLFGLQTLAGFP